GDNIIVSFTSIAQPSSPVGSYEILATLADPDHKLANYDVSIINGTLTVAPGSLVITADAASRSYGATNPPFTATLIGLANGDGITATCASVAITNSPVGTYPVVPSLLDPGGKLGNYVVSSVSGVLTITPAELVGHVDNKSRAYGQTNP